MRMIDQNDAIPTGAENVLPIFHDMRSKYVLAFLLTLFCLSPTLSHAQLWLGIIDPSRAVDWSNVGIPGGIPNRTTICTTLNPGATSAQINNAISSCPNGQVVFLNAGTYNLAGGIDFTGRSNVTLRGAGSDKTFLIFTGSTGCAGLWADICIASSGNPSMPSPSSTANWTAGYAKGATSITLSTTSGISVGSLIILDQLDDSSDPGTIFVCSTINVCAGEGGNAYGRNGRAQQQIVRVTAISGNTLTISPGLYMPNWRGSQSPGASWASATPGTMDGIENLSVDHTNGGATTGTAFLYVNHCWIKGVRSIGANRSHVWLYQAAENVIRDSYFYGTQNAASQSYGIESFSSSDNLIENNIFQHVTGPITVNGSDSGSVWSYNFAIDDYYAVSANWMIPSMIAHEAGIAMDLFEGNSGLGFEGDDIHGTHHFLTAFRNYFYGDTYNNPPKSNNTDVMHFWAFSRYFNVIGNVLGRTGYYTIYDGGFNGSPTDIYTLGDSPGGSVPNDSKVSATLMRWGNYDTVTGAVRWNSSEVPNGLAQYSNPLPGNQTLPASLYLSSKPSWWGTMPWPGVGPDVTGGPGPAGHAYSNPAQVCYNNTPKDSKGILVFNPTNCYGQRQPPAAPTNLTVVVH